MDLHQGHNNGKTLNVVKRELNWNKTKHPFSFAQTKAYAEKLAIQSLGTFTVPKRKRAHGEEKNEKKYNRNKAK